MTFSPSGPTPPGPIAVASQTVDTINFTWSSPQMMEHQQYGFLVSSVRGQNITNQTWFLLDALESGSPYNISVVTLGVLNYSSTEVTAVNYTSKWDWLIHSECISIYKLLPMDFFFVLFCPVS